MWPVCQQRKHSLSVLPFPPPLVRFLLTSYRGLVNTFWPFRISKRYTSPSPLPTNSKLPVTLLLASAPHFPIIIGARTTGTAVDDSHNVCPHLCVVLGNMCCWAVGHMERSVASRMSWGGWSPVRSRCLCCSFSRLQERATSHRLRWKRFDCCRPNFVQLPMGRVQRS